MKKKVIYIVCVLLMAGSMAFAKTDNQQSVYNMAVSFERNGEFTKAESLFVDLYNRDRENYNYYHRYRNILLLQRKYSDLLPVIEHRFEKRTYDRYLKLELGVLYFAMDDEKNAKAFWSDIFNGQQENMKDSYASAIYNDALEYGIGMEFYKITSILRSITKDPRLLVRYNFTNCLRYRDWDQAVAEIMHILDTDIRDLSYVRQQIFRYDPQSALYRRVISALQSTASVHGLILLSDIYLHLEDYDLAFQLLSDNILDEQVRMSMKDFAERMFEQEEFELADKAARLVERYTPSGDMARPSMALLSARAKESLFYTLTDEPGIIPYPYASRFLEIEFNPFDDQTGLLIKSAYNTFDSLSNDIGIYGELAAIHHADITYRVYQDFDVAMNEYYALSSRKNLIAKVDFLSKLSKVMLAKGEYSRALDLLGSAANEFGLMVHEEDQLLAQSFYISVMAGRRDSLIERADLVLAMFPQEDPLYNDLLAFTAIVNKAIKDSLNYEEWLKAERYLLMNNTASAIDIYKNLMDQNSEALAIYGLRYLDCLTARKDVEGETDYWNNYLDVLLQSEMGDYFMLRYAAFQEKMQKFDISYEIFEKYLLSYQESMYYENIREYVREHYSLGAP